MQMTRLQNKQVMNEIPFLINHLRFIEIFVFYLIPKIKKKLSHKDNNKYQ